MNTLSRSILREIVLVIRYSRYWLLIIRPGHGLVLHLPELDDEVVSTGWRSPADSDGRPPVLDLHLGHGKKLSLEE